MSTILRRVICCAAMICLTSSAVSAYTVKSIEGKFSIEFSEQPKSRTDKLPSPAGYSVDRVQWGLSQGVKSWVLSYSDHPAELLEKTPVQERYDNAVQSLNAQFKASMCAMSISSSISTRVKTRSSICVKTTSWSERECCGSAIVCTTGCMLVRSVPTMQKTSRSS